MRVQQQIILNLFSQSLSVEDNLASVGAVFLNFLPVRCQKLFFISGKRNFAVQANK